MSEAQIFWAGVIAVVIGCAVLLWACWATCDEAERRLGREPSWRELIFAGLCASIAWPASLLAVFAYVWWIMPTAAHADETMTAPAQPAHSTRD